jgi:EAL domain-containing protein (putative c-di-GMP-specific phosphodiesterase class I)
MDVADWHETQETTPGLPVRTDGMAAAAQPRQKIKKPSVLFVDDEAPILEAVALNLRRRPFAVLTATSAEGALSLLAREKVAVVVSDEQMPGMCGTALLGVIRRTYPDIVRMVLSGSAEPTAIARAVNEAGVFRYLLKPCSPDDLGLAVEQALEAHAVQQSVPRMRRSGLHVEDAIARFHMNMQPIYSSQSGDLFAHEALLRFSGGFQANAIELLEVALREERLWSVERAIRKSIATRLNTAPPNTSVFVNVHPLSLLDPELYSSFDGLGPHAASVVLEITERASLLEVEDLLPRIKALRRLGYRIAIDDMGSGYSGLNAFASLLPDFVKFDRELIESMHNVPVKLKLVSSIAKVCQELGIATIAEGIENVDELRAARRIGCTYLQGYLLGRPADGFQNRPFYIER